ncbi:MAG: GPW/gp25 family protein [Chloroflexi bacterium]|nr:GPW/gp25 family protein [Chloroflexota bacterium]
MLNADPKKAILGRGWGFPLSVGPRGGIELSSHEQDIEESICIILMTAKGERRMRPEFGCGIHDLVFAPNNATTFGLVTEYVQESLGWWEPRIEVQQVLVEPDPQEPSRLLIEIKYRIRATNDSRNLVYPFYRIPGEG